MYTFHVTILSFTSRPSSVLFVERDVRAKVESVTPGNHSALDVQASPADHDESFDFLRSSVLFGWVLSLLESPVLRIIEPCATANSRDCCRLVATPLAGALAAGAARGVRGYEAPQVSDIAYFSLR